MNKSQQHMEQMAALTMLAYAVGLLVGETLRDELYPPPRPTAPPSNSPPATDKPAARRCKWQMYPGLFILLKHKLSLSAERLRQLIDQALQAFATLVSHLSELKSGPRRFHLALGLSTTRLIMRHGRR